MCPRDRCPAGRRAPELSRSPALPPGLGASGERRRRRARSGREPGAPNFCLARESSAGDGRGTSASSARLGRPSPLHAGSSSPGRRGKAFFSQAAARAAAARSPSSSPSPPPRPLRRRLRLRGCEQGLLSVHPAARSWGSGESWRGAVRQELLEAFHSSIQEVTCEPGSWLRL